MVQGDLVDRLNSMAVAAISPSVSPSSPGSPDAESPRQEQLESVPRAVYTLPSTRDIDVSNCLKRRLDTASEDTDCKRLKHDDLGEHLVFEPRCLRW